MLTTLSKVRKRKAMNGMRIIFSYLCFLIVLGSIVQAEEDANEPKGSLQFNISRGVTLQVSNNKTSIVVRMSNLFRKNELEQRNTGRLKFNKGIFKKVGMTMMMVPMLLQLMSLPGTLASIKMTLLRSILVGKIALAVMLYNTLKNSQKSEVVLVHKPEYHEHYYHTYHLPEDDDEGGWWGR